MWIVVGPIIFIVVIALVVAIGVMTAQGGMPPTDYKRLFRMGIIFVGAGIPLMVGADMPALLFVGLAFMAAGGFNKDKWEENAEANRWENLTDEQRATRKMMTWLLLGLLILGLLVFGLVTLIGR